MVCAEDEAQLVQLLSKRPIHISAQPHFPNPMWLSCGPDASSTPGKHGSKYAEKALPAPAAFFSLRRTIDPESSGDWDASKRILTVRKHLETICPRFRSVQGASHVEINRQIQDSITRHRRP